MNSFDPSKYGVFANVVAISGTLVATFAVLIFNSLGKLTRWTWLTDDSPSFMVAAGARALTIALMVITFITINKYNYGYFGVVAVFFGAASMYYINKFNYLRKRHIVQIPKVGKNGKQLRDKKNRLLYDNVVIGSEDNMRSVAQEEYETARKKFGDMPPEEFMKGYGKQVNDPKALWSNDLLARISSDLTLYLMYIILLSVLTLFLASFVIDVHTRTE